MKIALTLKLLTLWVLVRRWLRRRRVTCPLTRSIEPYALLHTHRAGCAACVAERTMRR